MSLSATVESFLDASQLPFELLSHPLSHSALQSARRAHVSPGLLAKAVVVQDRDRYLMCVMPASHQLVLDWLNSALSTHYQLVPEAALAELFPDCDLGAVPALGQAYGLPVIWDSSLGQLHELYLEAGDHRHLIHLNRLALKKLMNKGQLATIACSAQEREFYRYTH